jgi:hypothetical protein
MSNKLIVLLAAVMVFAAACKSKKQAVQTPLIPVFTATDTTLKVKEVVLNTIDAAANTFGFYQARAKAAYKDDKQSLDLDVNIMMEKDKYIWMSVTAVLGIEVARVMITPDSVKILDRLHRKCILTDFGYIQRMSNVPLKLNNLQNMIAGNTIFSNSVQKSEVDTVLGVLAVYTILNTQRQNTFYSPQLKAQRTTITERDQSREMKISYNGFSQFHANSYPNAIDINIRAEKNLSCNFELSNFVFDKKREAQFTIPSGYEMVRP